MDVYNSIQGQIGELDEACMNNQKQLEQLKIDLESSRTAMDTMNEHIKKFSENFDFYQELKHFVENFADFLDAKVNRYICQNG